MASEEVVIHEHADGRVYVSGFPDVMVMSSALLRSGWLRELRWLDALTAFRLTFDNGYGEYEVVNYDRARDVYVCRRRASIWCPCPGSVEGPLERPEAKPV